MKFFYEAKIEVIAGDGASVTIAAVIASPGIA